MFNRDMHAELLEMAKQYPVVTVTGPRQSGKTTLVRLAFPDKPYVNLESIAVKQLVEADPVGFLDKYPDGAIIDEIQCHPELLSDIQVRVDAKQAAGMFILTGSHQVGLQGAIAQSLAGRTAVLHLLPMSLSELAAANQEDTLDALLLKGCFPRIYHDRLDPTKAYNGYVQTYLERDVRQMLEVKNLHAFRKFITLCAGRIGQVFNKESMANEVGVSSKTIAHWLSILEASYIIFLLPPYFENIGKRLIKSPKLYFCDVGLAAYLLGIETTTQMSRDPLRGQLFENLVILELIKKRWNQGLEHRLHFYRDSNQNEVDVLYQTGHHVIPIEIKSSKTFHASFGRALAYLKRIMPERVVHATVVYAGDAEQRVSDMRLLNYAHAARALDSS